MKKKRNNYFVVFILFISIYSCVNQGNKKEVADSFSDSLISILLEDTLYYPNGQIRVITPRLENGERNGEHRRYFENGKLEYKQTYFKDKLVGNQYWYHRNGKLAFYSVRNHDDNVFFFLQFDSLGSEIEKFGSIINTKYEIEGGVDTLKLNKTYLIRFLYADPKIYKFSLDSVIIETIRFKKHFKNFYFVKEKGEIIFEFKPKIRGSQKLTLYSSLKDKRRIMKYGNYLDIFFICKII